MAGEFNKLGVAGVPQVIAFNAKCAEQLAEAGHVSERDFVVASEERHPLAFGRREVERSLVDVSVTDIFAASLAEESRNEVVTNIQTARAARIYGNAGSYSGLAVVSPSISARDMIMKTDDGVVAKTGSGYFIAGKAFVKLLQGLFVGELGVSAKNQFIAFLQDTLNCREPIVKRMLAIMHESDYEFFVYAARSIFRLRHDQRTELLEGIASYALGQATDDEKRDVYHILYSGLGDISQAKVPEREVGFFLNSIAYQGHKQQDGEIVHLAHIFSSEKFFRSDVAYLISSLRHARKTALAKYVSTSQDRRVTEKDIFDRFSRAIMILSDYLVNEHTKQDDHFMP